MIKSIKTVSYQAISIKVDPFTYRRLREKEYTYNHFGYPCLAMMLPGTVVFTLQSMNLFFYEELR